MTDALSRFCSREWNIPVHNFCRRHIYSASREVQMSRPMATGLTFLISALAHELIMGCITQKFRGYGFVLMMLQMPLVMIQRHPWVRQHELANNVMFWIFMVFGLSLVSCYPFPSPSPLLPAGNRIRRGFSEGADVAGAGIAVCVVRACLDTGVVDLLLFWNAFQRLIRCATITTTNDLQLILGILGPRLRSSIIMHQYSCR